MEGLLAPCTPDLQDPDSQFPALLPKPTDGTPRSPPALAMLSRAEDGEDEAEAAIDEEDEDVGEEEDDYYVVRGGAVPCFPAGLPSDAECLNSSHPLPPSLRTSVLTTTMATMTTLMTAAGTTPSTDGLACTAWHSCSSFVMSSVITCGALHLA